MSFERSQVSSLVQLMSSLILDKSKSKLNQSKSKSLSTTSESSLKSRNSRSEVKSSKTSPFQLSSLAVVCLRWNWSQVTKYLRGDQVKFLRTNKSEVKSQVLKDKSKSSRKSLEWKIKLCHRKCMTKPQVIWDKFKSGVKACDSDSRVASSHQKQLTSQLQVKCWMF